MIVIIEPKTGKMSYYPSLKQACKWEKWMRYTTLKDKSISDKPLIYKGKWIYRIFHSKL